MCSLNVVLGGFGVLYEADYWCGLFGDKGRESLASEIVVAMRGSPE